MLSEREAEVQRALRGAVVVLPAVSYANVGELAVDVLVSTLQPQSLGQLESVNVLPVVGNDAYDTATAGAQKTRQPGRLCTALELFALEGHPLVLLQQRAPAMVGLQAAYAAELVSWLRAGGAAAVVVLSGLDAQLRRDQQLDSGPFRFLASNDELAAACTAPPPEAAAGEPGEGPLPLPRLRPLEPEIREEELQLHHSLPPWPLLQEATRQGLPHALLGCFAAEGDNAGEGLQLAARALRVLAAMKLGAGKEGAGGQGAEGAEAMVLEGRPVLPGVEGRELRAPTSWVGLYGRSFPQEIF